MKPKSSFLFRNTKVLLIIILIVLIVICLILILVKNNQKINTYSKNIEHYSNNISISNNKPIPKHKNLVFTSVGDNTIFDTLWLDKHKNYDVWVVYYGDNDSVYNKYKSKVDYIEKRKGSKYQNFHYIYNKYRKEIDKYERFFILDDDIIFKTDDISKMFEISKKYDLWLCQPSFDIKGKNSYKMLIQDTNYFLRYTNFVEVCVTLLNKEALHKFMKYYDPILIGWGIDYLLTWVIKPEKYKKRMAVIDEIICLNPEDNTYGKSNDREHNKIKNYDKEIEFWNSVKYKYNISDVTPKIYEKIKKELYAIHTVFIAKENILFLEEWIDYHIKLGFNKFYLYDNSKVKKSGYWNTQHKHFKSGKVNKYNINYDEIVKLTDKEIKDKLEIIKNKYKNVDIIDWSPLDKNGEVEYGQVKAHNHCLNKMKKDGVKWCANIDMDEFIVIDTFDTIQEYINSLNSNISNISMKQIIFRSRFYKSSNKLVIDIKNTSNSKIESTVHNSYKNIYRVNDTKKLDVHIWYGNGEQSDPIKDIYFNHYKLSIEYTKKKKDNINKNIRKKIEENSKNYIKIQ